ncbi:unnamed protein product [Effrenium voratum]|uniref:Uncharacterized protein n=1 Tax=Effrenium voratum TaxID=2562239 RepID=A0AA36HML9_9DINO|nr:unnamed protein product [Effrenium voratum]
MGPLKGRRSAPSRWPPQKRAPTPGRLREAQVDETGRPTLAVHLLEDQAVATIEDSLGAPWP